jgi:dTDP-4-dehydrorhamnose 3,5-epimerase
MFKKEEIEKLSPTGFCKIPIKKFQDNRGYFMEGLSPNDYYSLRTDNKRDVYLCENVSASKAGVFRGFHYQTPAQNKLIKVLNGSILDFAVCIDTTSIYYLKCYREVLRAGDDYALWIPSNHAHGFLALEENTIISYTVDSPYSSSGSKTINCRDPKIYVPWPTGIDPNNLIMSAKDIQEPYL